MNIYNIDLRLLRYFLAVAEELNFSRAATRLHISQPPLSQQIQELEARMETRLFARTKRKVELTRAGQYLVPLAKKLLRDMEESMHATRAIGRGQSGDLRMGIISSAPLVPAFGEALQAFKNKQPAVRLVFRELRHAQLLQALTDKEIDIGFMWQTAPPADKRLHTRILSADLMSFYVAHNHPLSRRKFLEISDLADEILFLTSLQARMAFAAQLHEAARQKNISLRISEEALHFPIIANLVASGSGIGVFPDYIARLATTKLVAKKLRPMPAKDMKMALAVAYSGGNDHALVKQFLSLL